MKIDAYNNVAQIHRISEVRAPQRTTAVSSVGQDRVSLSSDATFLSNIQDAMSQLEDVRPGIVEQTRADLAAGRVGTEEDLQRAIDALLMEL
jgi:hypothetical protein